MRRWQSRLGGDLLGALLFGSVLAPAAAAVRDRTALATPTIVISVAVSAVLGLVLLRLRIPEVGERRSNLDRAILFAAAIGTAVASAAIVQARSNAFYTPQALHGGMIVMLALYVGGHALRAVTMRDDQQLRPSRHAVPTEALREAIGFEHAPPNELRGVHPAMSATSSTEVRRARSSASLPAVVSADALTGVAAWLLILFWVLVALEHRHAASAVLLAVGGLIVLSDLALLPDVLFSSA